MTIEQPILRIASCSAHEITVTASRLLLEMSNKEPDIHWIRLHVEYLEELTKQVRNDLRSNLESIT